MAPKTPAQPSIESLEAKIDRLQAKVDELSDMQVKVVKLEEANVSLSQQVALLNKEVMLLKEKENNRDQMSRGNSVRLFGLSISEEEKVDGGKSLIKRVYDQIVKPVLAAAKTNKQIDSLPQLSNAIEDAYRIRPGMSKPTISGQPLPLPPPIIVKFANPAVRLAFLRNKRANLPNPSVDESAAGTRRYTVVEDLTGTNYKKLRELADSSEVDKAWSVDGRLRFIITGDKTVRRVKSVFDSVSDIINNSG